MRIIAGSRRSRTIKAPKGKATRPTQDKLKEAFFHKLGPYFQGGRMLDLYAGSGSVGLEALSRGMDEAVFVEMSREALMVIKENIKALDFTRESTVLALRDKRALTQLQGQQFDFIFLDPPYAYADLEDVLERIGSQGYLTATGVVLVEADKDRVLREVYGVLRCVEQRIYGITQLWYYQIEGDEHA